MLWLYLSLFSYFVNAVVAIADKFLISKKIPHPLAYSFYVGILSFFVVIFIPFGFFIPPIHILLTALLSGIIFLLYLIFFFYALFRGETSRVVPLIGGLTPIFTLVFSFLFLGEGLNFREFIAFALLVAGSVLISFKFGEKFHWDKKGFIMAALAALFFAFAFVSAKYVYLNQPFINGFIWTRIGSFLAALFLLILPSCRHLILKHGREGKKKTFFFTHW